MKFNRRDTLILGAAASALTLCGVGSAQAAAGDTVDQAALMAPAGGYTDHFEGSETAPVTVIEYVSPTCPHCAQFATDVKPTFVEQYVDTGKVRLITRPFVRNVLDAAIFMLAEAAGPENYANVVDTYFATMNTWATSETPRDAIFDIAVQLGFTQESFDAALTNQELFAAMEAVRDQALNDFGLSGTPTFYVNGKTLTGGQTLEQLAAEIDPLVPADFVPTEPASSTATDTNAMAPSAPAESNTMAPATPADTNTMAPATDASPASEPGVTPVD